MRVLAPWRQRAAAVAPGGAAAEAGQPHEVASFVVFLASDESRYATGSEFVMDGGLVIDVPHK